MRHGAGYKYIRAVPKDLRTVAGKRFWTRYIGSTSHEQAKAKALLYAAEDQRLIDRLKGLPSVERDAIAGSGGLDVWRRQNANRERTIPFLKLGASLEPDSDMPDEMQASDALSAFQARRALQQVETESAFVQKIERKLVGETQGALQKLVDLWEEVRPSRSDKVKERVRLYVSRFIDVVGNIEPKDVRRDHAIAFRDELQKQGLKSDNIAQHLAKLHTLFNVAISEGAFLISFNPIHGVKARPDPKAVLADDAEDEGFTASEVRRIFEAMKGESDDFQWIVRLLAYHGARGKEICQLRCDDVTKLHGIDVIRVHDKSGGSVKNRQSVRDIPIHPKCCGIIAYAAKVAKQHGADAYVFQSLKTTRTTGREHSFQNYANGKFLREKVGITDRRPGSRQYNKSIHSFRHRFSTLCREVEMPDAIKYALKGHALGKGEGGKYGAAPSLKVRAKWIAKIEPLKA